MNQKHMDEISLEIHKGLKITGGNALIKYIWDFIVCKFYPQIHNNVIHAEVFRAEVY